MREALPRKGDDSPIRVPRDAARAPHAPARPPRFVDRSEELVGVRSLVATAEVRRRRTSAHELDVHVRVRGVDVAKQAAEAVSVVELRIGFELDPFSGRRESLELTA